MRINAVVICALVLLSAFGRNPSVREAPAAKDAEAQYQLGLKYAYGDGVDREWAEAAKAFAKAAEQGHSSAQRNLGLCYEKALGVQQDHARAVEWYRKAAERGDLDAQYNLGACYAAGRGVKQDRDKAVEWYRNAAACYRAGNGGAVR